MGYDVVIGLEVHIQLSTRSKIFCSCSTDFGAPPNTHVCPVCLGLPGVLPVLNREVVEYAIRLGCALECRINRYSRFARKNYFYPDLPKGYQISQYEFPILEGGHVDIYVGGRFKEIELERIHMEEDAGKTVHRGEFSYVDFNRAGVPLLEIVSKPVITSPHEAYLYLKSLRTMVRYLGICDGNMAEGSLRCDANISLKPVGSDTLGTKVEIKNMNSFKHVEDALAYEVERQGWVLDSGGAVVQETRLWDEKEGVTKPMRTKEEAYEYRYFPEPDLPPLRIDDSWIESVGRDLVELPKSRFLRILEEYSIKESDALILTEEKELADYFERAAHGYHSPQIIANWILTELLGLLNRENREISAVLIRPEHIRELMELIDSGKISGKIAKMVFKEMYETGKPPGPIVKEKGLVQITDEVLIRRMAEKVVSENPKAVEKYMSGKKNTLGFFVGQVMKETKGKANPSVVNRILTEILEKR